MLKVVVFNLIVCFVMACALAARAENRVTVKPVVEIDASKANISLSDVVVAQGLSAQALAKFKTIKLSDAPAQGESRVFTSEVIAESIKTDLEDVEASLGEHFEIKIPSRVTVLKKNPSLTAKELKAQILSNLKAQCGECEFEITNFSAPSAKLATGAVWSLHQRNELPKGSFNYPIEVSLNDVPQQTYWVSGQVSVRRPVPVAAREIQVGERLQPEDLVTQMKDITYASDTPIAVSELSSGVTARSIAAGQVVYRSALRRELAVKNGDSVKVETGTDEWSISISGVSQSSGYIGDQVKVKIPGSSKVVAGTLKEKGVVEVVQ